MGRTIVQADVGLAQIERVLVDFTGGQIIGLAVNYHAIDDQGQRIDPPGYSRTFEVPLTPERIKGLEEAERRGLETFVGIVEALLLPPMNRAEERKGQPEKASVSGPDKGGAS